MTFVDTSAIYALVDNRDADHVRAVEIFTRLLASHEPLLTHSYVIVETVALVQRRLGVGTALIAAARTHQFEIEWIDQTKHNAAMQRLERTARRHVSLVDCVSFVVMQQRGIDTAFAFDPDFEAEGFRLCRLAE